MQRALAHDHAVHQRHRDAVRRGVHAQPCRRRRPAPARHRAPRAALVSAHRSPRARHAPASERLRVHDDRVPVMMTCVPVMVASDARASKRRRGLIAMLIAFIQKHSWLKPPDGRFLLIEIWRQCDRARPKSWRIVNLRMAARRPKGTDVVWRPHIARDRFVSVPGGYPGPTSSVGLRALTRRTN